MNVNQMRGSLMAVISFISFFVTGCSSIVRENIISSINTGIGATIAENPQTQLYEVKIGYIRSQFYSIPTGKMVLVEDSELPVAIDGKTLKALSKYNPNTSNKADLTPELVSGIKVHSGAEHLFLGVDVSENFAVGKEAVNSRAATAMYITEAQNAGVASAASLAAQSTLKISTVSAPEVQSLVAEVAKKYSGSSKEQQEKIEKIVKDNGYKTLNSFVDATSHDPVPFLKIISEVNKL